MKSGALSQMRSFRITLAATGRKVLLYCETIRQEHSNPSPHTMAFFHGVGRGGEG